MSELRTTEEIEADLRSDNVRVQHAAIDAAWPLKSAGASLVPALTALLTSDRYVPCSALKYDFSGHDVIAFKALSAIEAIGVAPAREALAALLTDRRIHVLPEACYDQGAYIGDYASQEVAPAALAARLVAVLGAAGIALAPQLATNARSAAKVIAEPARLALVRLAVFAAQASPEARASFGQVVASLEAEPDAQQPAAERGFTLRDCVANCRKHLEKATTP